MKEIKIEGKEILNKIEEVETPQGGADKEAAKEGKGAEPEKGAAPAEALRSARATIPESAGHKDLGGENAGQEPQGEKRQEEGERQEEEARQEGERQEAEKRLQEEGAASEERQEAVDWEARLAEAEQKGYLRGRQERIEELMREPAPYQRQGGRTQSPQGNSEPMILNNPRVSIWDR